MKTLAVLTILVILIVPRPSSGFYRIGRELGPRPDIEGNTQEAIDNLEGLGRDDLLRYRMAVLRAKRLMEKKQGTKKRDLQ
jgi:hypothetical protein